METKLRVYRQISLTRALKRAKEIAEAENLQLEEPPLKFLVPYLEDCSLEQPDDTKLIDMWARLLTSASSNFKSEHNLFVRILREITRTEAELFEHIVSHESHRHCIGSRHLQDVESDWRDEYVYIELKKCILSLGGMKKILENNNEPELEKIFRARNETPGSLIYFFDIAAGNKGEYPLDDIYTSPRSRIDDDFEPISASMLKSLGLIGEYKSPEIWIDNYCFIVFAYYVTGVGTQFTESCTNIPVFYAGKDSS